MASPATATPSTAADLLDLLRRSGIHRTDFLDEKVAGYDLPDDAAGAAEVLVRGGLLTGFQSRLLLAGKHRGFRLGTYVIKDMIGKGGMGTVYLAEHATLRRKVAVKVLAADGAAQKAGVERFQREARAAAALDHPNIVRVFDVLQQGEVHYIVMEYVEGRTLDSLVAGGGAMAPGRAVGYISQAAAGLQHAYEKGFIHRDVKPANLMVTKDGTVKVLDMGLARSLVDDGDRVTEQLDSGAVVGTADFISPEQATNSPGVDIRADIYSLGATLFVLVAGQPPFTGSTSQVLMQHQLKTAPSLADFDRTIAPGLAAVVARMLAKKAADRFATPAEVIAALAPWLPNRDGAQKVMAGLSTSELGRNSGNLQNTLDQVMSGSTGRINVPARARGRGVWVAAGAAAAALLLAGGGYLLMGGPTKEIAPTAGSPAGRPDVAVNTPPKATPPVAANSPVRASRPAPRPTAAHLYALDLSAQQPFSDRGRTGGDWTWQTEQKTGPGGLPAGWRCFHWSLEATGEYFADADGGRMALGMRTHTGAGSAMLFTPPVKFAGGPVPVTVEYRTDSGSPALMQVRFQQTVPTAQKAMDVTELPSTGGEWKTTTFELDPKGAAEGFLEFHNHQLGADHAVRLRGLTVGAGPPAAGSGLLRWDASSVPAFRFTIQGLDRVTAGVRPGELPAGNDVGNWAKDTVGEFVCEVVAGRPAVGLAARSGAPSSQFTVQLEEAGIELDAGREYVARFDYLTRGDGCGVIRVQDLKNNHRPYAETRFEPTGGEWRTGEVRFQKAPGGTTRLAFQSPETAAAGLAYLGRLEVFDPAAATATRFTPVSLSEVATAVTGTNHAMFSSHPQDRYLLADWDRREVSGVPFDLTALPGGEGGRLIMLRGAAGAQAKAAPDRVSIPLNRPAAAVHFLGGVAAWGWPYRGKESGDDPLGKVVLTVRLRYADGQVEEFPWKNGEHVADFFKREDVPGSEFAFADENGHQVRYLAVKPSRPAPLAAIELVKGELPYLTPLVLAVTVESPAAPAAPPAAPAGAMLYRFDPAAVPEFRGTLRGWDKVLYGTLPKFPAGIAASSWKPTATADFTRAVAAGRPALGYAARGADPTAEIVFNLAELGVNLDPDREYLVRFDYLTEEDAGGVVRAQQAKDAYPTLAEWPLEPTAGQWRTGELRFRPAAGAVTRLAFQSVRSTESGMTHIGRLEVYDPAGAAGPVTARPSASEPAAARGPRVYALDLAGLSTFRGRFADGKPEGDTPTGVAGVSWHCWKKGSVAEFRGEATDAGPAVGVTNLNDDLSSQVNLPLDDAPGGLALTPGKRYVLRVQYKTANDAAGRLEVRTPDDQSVAQVGLAGTGGGWKWAEVPVGRAEDKKLHAVVENTAVGEGNTLWLRAAEVYEAR